MQSILREKLMVHAIKLAHVSNLYRNEGHLFVQAYYHWLDETEKDLSRLRTPISILLQAEKSLLTSVLDGFTPSYIQGETSARKRQRAVAAQSLSKVSGEIQAKIENIDQIFQETNEKLYNVIALLASQNPELFVQLKPNQHGVDLIRKALATTPETLPMFNYCCAKLPPVDRDYLLQTIIENIVRNRL